MIIINAKLLYILMTPRFIIQKLSSLCKVFRCVASL